MRAFSARNSVQPFYEFDSWVRRCWRKERRRWKRGRRGVRPWIVPIFVHSSSEPKESEGREHGEVASDKWTGFNLRPINILVLFSLSPSLSCPCVCLFVVPRLSFAFSRAFTTCVKREVISCPPRDPRPVFFYYSMTRIRESTKVQ